MGVGRKGKGKGKGTGTGTGTGREGFDGEWKGWKCGEKVRGCGGKGSGEKGRGVVG